MSYPCCCDCHEINPNSIDLGWRIVAGAMWEREWVPHQEIRLEQQKKAPQSSELGMGAGKFGENIVWGKSPNFAPVQI